MPAPEVAKMATLPEGSATPSAEVIASFSGCLRKPVSERAHARRQTPAAPCRRRSQRPSSPIQRTLRSTKRPAFRAMSQSVCAPHSRKKAQRPDLQCGRSLMVGEGDRNNFLMYPGSPCLRINPPIHPRGAGGHGYGLTHASRTRR